MRRRSRFGRSGISSLIGAIFFILVVFLVFSSTVLIFENFVNYGTTFKQENQQDLDNKATNLSFSDLSFGANTTYATNETIQGVNNAQSSSLDPIQNMNFTSSMSGWTFSRAYELSLNNATVTNYPENVLPGLEVYTLTITNDDPAAGAHPKLTAITSVEISVSPSFTVPASVQEAPSGWTLASPSSTCTSDCNSIVWTTSCPTGVDDGDTVSFEWAAVAPPVTGSYFHTVTVTWVPLTGADVCPATTVAQKGLTPIATSVVTSAPGGTYTAKILSVSSGTVPSGAYGGYDAVSAIGSDSGPGSVYITYAPSLNGVPLTSGEQLTSELNYTTDFTVPSGGLALSPGCCTLSLGYGLESLISNSSQILLNVYLQNVTDIASTGHVATDPFVKQIVNNTVVNELNGQNVSSTGWEMNPDVHFGLSTSNIAIVSGGVTTLPAGLYELTIEVSATLFGANAPSSAYPASMLMHLDDIGLAFQEAAVSSYCADTAASGSQPCNSSCTSIVDGAQVALASCAIALPTGDVDPGQVQSLRFSAQVSSVNPSGEATAYAYIEDIGASSSAPSWVELGQVTFTSSVAITATIPASSAAQYLDVTGRTCTSSDIAGSVCVRIYVIQQATSASNISWNLNASVSVQTWAPDQGVLYVLNNGTSPAHLVSLDVAGPSVSYSDFNLSDWVSPGQVAPIILGQGSTVIPTFAWTTGQTYVVTVVTDEGVVITGTFVSP